MNLSSSVSFPRKRESSGFAAEDTGTPLPACAGTSFARTAYAGGAALLSSLLSLVTNQETA
jgi:hypothetical protein